MALSEYLHPDKAEARRLSDETARRRRAETRAIRLERFLRVDEREPEDVLKRDRDPSRIVSVHGTKTPNKKPDIDAATVIHEHFEAPEPTDVELAQIEEEGVLEGSERVIFEGQSTQETDIFSASGLDARLGDSVYRPIFAGYEDFDRRLMTPRDRREEADFIRDAWGSYASTHQDQEH